MARGAGGAGETEIRAPADGVALRVDAKKGNWRSGGGPPIMSIGDCRTRVRAKVNEQDLGRIRVGQAALVRVARSTTQIDGRVPRRARGRAEPDGFRRSAQLQRC